MHGLAEGFRCGEGLQGAADCDGYAAGAVEVAHLSSGSVGVRDSKNPAGPALVFAPGEWDAFTSRLAGGGFDR